MGAGIYGGFGSTYGYKNRIGRPVEPLVKTYEMALSPSSYSKAIVTRYGINLKGSGKRIKIVYNPNLKPGVYGKVEKKHPRIIQIGPSALVSEKELANTIAHELNHSRSYLRGGNAPESSAYKSGNTLSKYIGGKK